MFGCEQAEQLVQSDTSATASLEYTFYWQRSLIINTVCNHLSRFMGCTRHAGSVESRSGRCANKCLPGPNPLLRVLADETHRSQSLFQIYRMHLSNLFPRVAFRAVALPRGGKWLRRTRGRLPVVATSGTTSAIRCVSRGSGAVCSTRHPATVRPKAQRCRSSGVPLNRDHRTSSDSASAQLTPMNSSLSLLTSFHLK
jgi:hypothetical protein